MSIATNFSISYLLINNYLWYGNYSIITHSLISHSLHYLSTVYSLWYMNSRTICVWLFMRLAAFVVKPSYDTFLYMHFFLNEKYKIIWTEKECCFSVYIILNSIIYFILVKILNFLLILNFSVHLNTHLRAATTISI